MRRRGSSSGIVIGLLIVAVGVLLLLDSTGLVGIDGIVRWAPSLVILFGLWRLIANGFRRIFWPVLIITIGLLVQLSWLGLDGGIFWPVILIVIGLAIVLKWATRSRSNPEVIDGVATSRFATDDGEVDSFEVFGSTRERAASGDFRGGRITAVMGNSQLDLRDAVVVDRPATLEATVVMGEARLRIPPGWNVRFDNSTVMGESRDERSVRESFSEAPDLVITGTVTMGSLKIDD